MSCPLLLAALVAVTACSSMTVNQDFDPAYSFGLLKTFAILPATPESGMNDLDAKRVFDALRSELIAKGYQESKDPHFRIAVHFGTQQQTQIDSYGYGYGYGWHGGGGGVEVYQYNEGTLIIDFVDSATNSLIWRGTGQGAVADNPDPQRKTANINAAVVKIVAQFPPR